MTDQDYLARRFPMTSLSEAARRARETERWVFPNLVCSSITLVYGQSNVGKSFLISSLLLSLMVEGREFMGRQPTDPGKEWRPAILCTDPGSEDEYGARISMGIPEDVELDIPLFSVGVTRTSEDWTLLTDHLIGMGRNIVVLDNLMGVTGDSTDPLANATVFDALNRLVSRGVPVIVLHHETEKRKPPRGGPPMGVSESVQESRVWIQVRQTERKKLRGGNTGLYVQSNHLDQPYEIIAEPLVGPDYRVLSDHPLDEEGNAAPRRIRTPEGMDQTAAMAAYVVEHCPTATTRQAGAALAQAFPGVAASSAQSWLAKGNKLGALIHKPDGRWAWRG